MIVHFSDKHPVYRHVGRPCSNTSTSASPVLHTNSDCGAADDNSIPRPQWHSAPQPFHNLTKVYIANVCLKWTDSRRGWESEFSIL